MNACASYLVANDLILDNVECYQIFSSDQMQLLVKVSRVAISFISYKQKKNKECEDKIRKWFEALFHI